MLNNNATVRSPDWKRKATTDGIEANMHSMLQAILTISLKLSGCFELDDLAGVVGKYD